MRLHIRGPHEKLILELGPPKAGWTLLELALRVAASLQHCPPQGFCLSLNNIDALQGHHETIAALGVRTGDRLYLIDAGAEGAAGLLRAAHTRIASSSSHDDEAGMSDASRRTGEAPREQGATSKRCRDDTGHTIASSVLTQSTPLARDQGASPEKLTSPPPRRLSMSLSQQGRPT